MGAFLDKPEVTKRTEVTVGNGLNAAVSDMQGWRVNMEDAHICLAQLPKHNNISLFAVFDGHGGAETAKLSAEKLAEEILGTKEFQEYKSSNDQSKLAAALRQGVLNLDQNLRGIEAIGRSGSTAVMCLITDKYIIIGNCGDSRALLVRGEDVHFASQDHKPTNPSELERIRKAGGFVNLGRVCGNLAVSRALGDFEFKDSNTMADIEQKISPESDMEVIERGKDNFLLLACDGIWDVMTNEQVTFYIVQQLKRGKKAKEISEDLLDLCLERGSKDNMTVNLILFPDHTQEIPGLYNSDEEANKVLEEKLSELEPPGDRFGGIISTPAEVTPTPAPPTPEATPDEAEQRPTSPMSPN